MRGKLIPGVLLLVVAGLCLSVTRVVAATNVNVQVVNLSAHEFAVAWTTTQSVKGSIQYGTSCAGASAVGTEVTSSNGFVHLAYTDDLKPLAVDTRYFFKLVDNGVVDDNGGKCYQVTTLKQDAGVGTPDSILGSARLKPACTDPAIDALVTVTVTRGILDSLPLAVTTSTIGGWLVSVGGALTPDGQLFHPASGDTLHIVLATGAASENTARETVTYSPPASGTDPQEVPMLCATAPAENSDSPTVMISPSPGATLTTTPTITLTPTLTPTIMPGANTATPQSTSTATATGTPIPPSPTPSPTASPVPTFTITATATAIPTVTSTPRVVPTRHECTPGTGSTARLIVRTSLSPKTLTAGSDEHLLVMTHPGACLQVAVTYAHQSGSYLARGKTGPKGMWRHTWTVIGSTGRASIHITARFGGKTTTVYRHIDVR